MKKNRINHAKKYFYLFQVKLSIDVGIPTMRHIGETKRIKYTKVKNYMNNSIMKEVIHNILNKNEL